MQGHSDSQHPSSQVIWEVQDVALNYNTSMVCHIELIGGLRPSSIIIPQLLVPTRTPSDADPASHTAAPRDARGPTAPNAPCGGPSAFDRGRHAAPRRSCLLRGNGRSKPSSGCGPNCSSVKRTELDRWTWNYLENGNVWIFLF